MKKILIVLGAGALLIGCASDDEGERQWSSLDPNGYRSEEPWHTYRPSPPPVEEEDPPPVELKPRINGQSGFGPER